jgi:hypothetical protein
MEEAVKVKLTAESLDINGNVVSIDENSQPIDRDTILTFDVELDEEGKIKLKHVGGRPKRTK